MLHLPTIDYSAAKSTLRSRLTSTKSWIVPKTASAFAPEGTWSNTDCEPTPREEWTWNAVTFFEYWCSDLISATSWTAVSSYTAIGLSWWESLLAIFTAGVILSVVIVYNGIIGARLHTPFAITCRSVFGIHLSKFVIVSRCAIAIFWLSVVTYQGGGFVTQMLIALWPSYANLPNHFSESSGLTSQAFLSFVLFWAIQLPFILIHPKKLKWLFVLKLSTIPLVAIGMMAYSIHAAGDQVAAALIVPAGGTYFTFFTATTASMGVWITLGCNIGDFSRYSKKESSSILQLLVIPVLWVATSTFGAISTNCLQVATGQNIIQPQDIIALWQTTPGGRAAAFLCSLAWIFAGIGTNITANSVSAANDLCTLFPKYIDIFRGQMLSVTIGVFAFAPWKVLASASSFISFMSSYSVVLAPVAGILCADYYLVKGSRINVPELYKPHGIYRYTGGFNWRALAALVCAIGPAIPGIGASLDPNLQIGGAKYIFMIGDIWGIVIGALVHVALSRMFPDLRSLSASNVYAQDVLDGKKLEAYSETRTGDSEVEEKKEDGGVVVTVLAV